MRQMTILLNVVMIGVFMFLLVTKGIPKNAEDFFFASLFFLVPSLSLWALLIDKRDDWLSLYFKRKALEERKKIESLSSTERRP